MQKPHPLETKALLCGVTLRSTMNTESRDLRDFPHSRALVCLQRSCECLQDAVEFLCGHKKRLSPQEVGELYARLRSGGVNMKQVNAAIKKVCTTDSVERSIEMNVVGKLFKELDQRYFILQSAQWDFAMLDRSREGNITEKDALFLFKAVHGDHFTMGSWTAFQRSHPLKVGSKVTWEEIEVPLCDIPSMEEGRLIREREEQLVREREEQLTREREEQLVREREEQLAREREEQLAREREEQLTREREEQLVREREEQLAREHEELAKECEEQLAREREEQLVREREIREQEEREKAEAVDREESVQEEGADTPAMNEHYLRLRANLEKAIVSQEIAQLEPAIKEVKKEGIPNCAELLKKAEQLLKKLHVARDLQDATVARRLGALELAVDAVKKGGWEKDLQKEMDEANRLLEKLQRLEQRKRAVLELSQRVVAELKSYSNPPPLVHQVMSATFLLLGNPEKETKSWQATQILIGKTGKGGLKRRVAQCSAEQISLSVARRALTMLKQYDFVTVQDTSLGCAAFYSWAEGMIEEVEELKNPTQ